MDGAKVAAVFVDNSGIMYDGNGAKMTTTGSIAPTTAVAVTVEGNGVSVFSAAATPASVKVANDSTVTLTLNGIDQDSANGVDKWYKISVIGATMNSFTGDGYLFTTTTDNEASRYTSGTETTTVYAHVNTQNNPFNAKTLGFAKVTGPVTITIEEVTA